MKGLLTVFTLISTQLMAQQTLNWKFQHPVKKTWIEAGTHGSVQEKLIDVKELPDPFYGKNELLFRWIEDHQWEFVSDFVVTNDQLKKDFIELEFPGIDTYADIYLNDSLIGFAQNAFRPYKFDVKDLLRSGMNQLRVVFTPPVMYHKEAYQKAKYKLPAPNDVDSIAIAPYTRKPQYQFGWDWSLRMNTIGFLKPVSLNFIHINKIAQTNIITEDIGNDEADMLFEMILDKPARSKMVWNSKMFGKVEIMPGETRISRKEIIKKPELWWPKGQGNQHLYFDEWELLTDNGAEGKLIETKTVRFGIRKTELITEADRWGTSYVIKVNGREIFCKGGDYIPQDIFPARVTDAELQKMVQDMANANFNMVRVWGGGYYPDDTFYNACDELGLMVWQDFMFACAMYPGDPDFLENVKEEVSYQIPRIASHPCLTLFNGNNEVDVAWKNWGFQAKYNLYNQSAKEIEAAYDRLFKQLLPNQVNKLSNAPYIHTSPLSNWGKDEFYNHGSQHYWGVWHGKDPMENFAKKIGRFNAEYGFQSFPEYSTLLSFSDKTQWDLNSDVMKHHQKSYVGNGMILKHAQLLYGNPSNFEEFVYFSQLTQATAVSMAVTGHRLDAPRCMGTLYWQVNDCWPAPSWSSIDYYGNWKALQYWVKKDYEEVAVLCKKNDQGEQEYFLLSSAPDTFNCEVTIKAFDLEGKVLISHTAHHMISGTTTVKLSDSCLVEKLKGKNYVIYFEWENEIGQLRERTFSNLIKQYRKAELKDVEITMDEFDPVNKKARVLVYTKKYMRNFWLYSDKKGMHFENNFEDLLPGTHEFILHYEEMPELSDLKFKWM